MIRVLLADDHAIIRDGLKVILSGVPDMAVVGEAGDGQEALALLRRTPADVVVLDISMPGQNGIALIGHIKAIRPAHVLVLSMHPEGQYALQALRHGASGYMTKNSAATHLIDGIRMVANGEMFVSRDLVRRLAGKSAAHTAQAPHEALSRREFQVFHLLVEGRDINAIARSLALSNKTISTHKANLLRKLEIDSTAGLVHYAVRHGLLAGRANPEAN